VTKTRTRSQRHLPRQQTSQYREQESAMLLVPHRLRHVEELSVVDGVDDEAGLLAVTEVRISTTSSAVAYLRRFRSSFIVDIQC